MKYYMFEQGKSKKKLNKKNAIKFSIIAIVILLLIALISLYSTNENFRKFLDKYILRKDITQENVAKIEVLEDENRYVYAFNKNIAVLEKNSLEVYNSFGKKEYNIEISISNPIFKSNNRYLAIAEKEGQKLYLISGTNIVWQKDLEGTISKLNINKNGYISVILSNTSYKTVIITFSPDGKELFTTYLSSTYGVDVDISNDNMYLAIAECDVSRSNIQSSIKVISLEEAKHSGEGAIIYNEVIGSYALINNIKYQSKNVIMVMHDTGIVQIHDDKKENFIAFDSNTIFANINLTDYVLKINKEASGIFSNKSSVKLINITTKKESTYELDGIPKSVKTMDNMIALNLGSEVHFINTNGWLIKKYTSNQEIKDIILSSSIAAILYKDRIEIVNL